MSIGTKVLPKVCKQSKRGAFQVRKDDSKSGQHDEHEFLHLKEENSRLRTDVSRLRVEKARLQDENTHLSNANSQLQDELRLTSEELQEEKKISEYKDIELAKGTALYQILEEEYLRLIS